jgi:hypothetical protein
MDASPVMHLFLRNASKALMQLDALGRGRERDEDGSGAAGREVKKRRLDALLANKLSSGEDSPATVDHRTRSFSSPSTSATPKSDFRVLRGQSPSPASDEASEQSQLKSHILQLQLAQAALLGGVAASASASLTEPGRILGASAMAALATAASSPLLYYAHVLHNAGAQHQHKLVEHLLATKRLRERTKETSTLVQTPDTFDMPHLSGLSDKHEVSTIYV